MKVITKLVRIENEEFYLISDYAPDGELYYGTIPYTATKNGVLIKALNGFQMCISDTAGGALDRRQRDIITNRKIDQYIAEGYSRENAIFKAFGLDEVTV